MERFQASRSLAEKEENREGLASSLHAIALLHVQEGRLREALDSMLQVLSLDRMTLEEAKRAGAAGPVQAALEARIANDLYDLARIHRRQGDPHAALERLQEALGIDLRLGHEQGAAISHNNIGRFLVAFDRFEEAEKHYRAALALFEKLKDETRAREVRHNIEFLEKVRHRAGRASAR